MILVSKKPQMDGSSAAICKKNDGLEALLPRYEELTKVKRREVSSKKAEINEAEGVAQSLKDEIQSLHGPGRASAIFNVALLEEDIARKKEQAAQIIPNLEATTEQKRVQLIRLTGSPAKAGVPGRNSNAARLDW